jgi:hypothetical protein
MAELNTKLDAYLLRNPQDSLDLSGTYLGADGAKIIAEFLPQW